MKRFFIIKATVAAIIGIAIFYSGPTVSVADAADYSNSSSPGNMESFKSEFAYQMAQITSEVVTCPATDVDKFKAAFAYAAAKVTAKVMPILPGSQRNEFSFDMAQITTKIIDTQNLDIEKAKTTFAYEAAQLTSKILANKDIVTGKYHVGAAPQATAKTNFTLDSSDPLLKNNAAIERKQAGKASPPPVEAQSLVNVGAVDAKTYNGLINGLSDIGKKNQHPDHKINIDGEVRYHYAFNGGSSEWDKDTSGIRTYIGFGSDIYKGWRLNGMFDIERSIENYNNKFKLARLNVTGKIRSSVLTAGAFGWTMAEGNIYDSEFEGFKMDWGDTLKYTFSLGNTDASKKTVIATARYNNLDYNLEAGVYHYRTDDSLASQNTLAALSGNYNFNDFGLGAMYLRSDLKDGKGNSSGYVLSLIYGEVKTYLPNTYSIYAKYYDQPKYTYIAHGMNGLGSTNGMQGFKGYGVGVHYTLTDNLVGGVEYFNLTDKVSGERGKTLWSELTHYF